MDSQRDSAHTSLGRWLPVARAAWAVLAIACLMAFAAALGSSFDQLRAVCAGEKCEVLALTSREADTLRDIGLSLEFYATVQVGYTVVGALISTLLALLIVWRRSDDPVGLFVSITLIMMSTIGLTTAPKP